MNPEDVPFLRAVRQQHIRPGNEGKNRIHWKAFQLKEEEDRPIYSMSLFLKSKIDFFAVKDRIDRASDGEERNKVAAICTLLESELITLEEADLIEDPDDSAHFEITVPIEKFEDQEFITRLKIWYTDLRDAAFRNRSPHFF